ncbi:beta-ketoacyl synthase N-terminal-like domain-containing protein [Chitinophaga sancti]|uniref:beta-ketoacyl synthase N-terminal-like domain-containing protein n=1 Tax=Chitinophaga sancti TaxID=1004 RepID=UPI002A759C9F|nr:beta-ketoacyl synthase N-terminal-like domain-containing protein [Chitinophaga sancti]WPQ64897.1 beta-ketoacyl synthase N-terminal-like domain-containing protein [Chitinophaga sancti]
MNVAIIGMSGIFPGAGNIQAFWQNIIQKKDAIQAVPENRLDATFFDTETIAVDRFYCRKGGFIDEFATFDPIRFGILPLAVEGTEPEQLITLALAQQALQDAGILDKHISLEKTGIIIGKGNYPGPGATRAIEIVRTGEQIVQLLQTLLPHLSGADLEKVKKEFQQKKGRFGPDTAMGLIPNLVASLVANRLNLGGVAYTLDAACASSLLAVDHGIQELSTGRADMIIAGGVHVSQNAPFWSIFTQLGALSRRQQIRPFDQQADGLLIGEGCGFVVLKRLDDAIADNDRIYAVIKGSGISSDGAGTSVMSPAVKGQAVAIRQAWQKAGVSLDEIGYIEAHGTGTPLGDKTELETLAQVFGQHAHKAGIGSVKSMIGHAMPAAGMAGLIKTALALYHNTLPPTLHCEEPVAAMQDTRFAPVQEATDWQATGLPLRAGVNAFGFGGINAHLVVEGFNSLPKGVFNGITPSLKADVLLLARNSADALIRALENKETDPGQGDYRIALFDPSPERIKKAVKIVGRNTPWRNKQDIWFTNEPLISKGGKVAFLFAGLDGLGGGEVDSVAAHFNLPGAESNKDSVYDSAITLLERSRIIDTALKQMGIRPDLNAGHSMGEWLAGRSAGMATEASILEILQDLNPQALETENAKFLVTGIGYDQLLPLLEGKQDIYLSMDNCPQQVILCGTDAAVADFIEILKAKQIFYQVLPFQSGFHSPFVAKKTDVLLAGISKIQWLKPEIPFWSATTLDLYPDTYEAIRDLSVDHLIKPVRFRELTQKLYEEENVRVFIQAGAGGLIGFVDDTLKGKSYSAIAANVPTRSGLDQLQRVMAALFVEGKPVNPAFLGISPKAKPGMPLQLGSPFIKELESLKGLSLPAPAMKPAFATVRKPVLQAFLQNVDEISAIQDEIIALFNDPITVQPISHTLNISLENTPYLIDHALVKQKPGWPIKEDMDPVIPMTMIFELFGDVARANGQNRAVKRIYNIQVFQWMNVSSPFKETITGKWEGNDTVHLDLPNYANASVQLTKQYPVPPARDFSIGASLDSELYKTPEQIYERHMFHGPGYQGIRKIVHMGEKGITGIIESSTGKGSLLDNAGQLFGLWLQLTLTKDRIAFPVKIHEIAFYGDMRDQSGSFECTCQLTELNDEFATADFVIKKAGQIWAIVTGWQNRRLEIDEALWQISMAPLQNKLAKEIAPGVFTFNNAYQRVVSWDFIQKRYLNQAEKAFVKGLMPMKRKERIISRVAAKDAVRAVLQHHCFPIEFEIKNNAAGAPYVAGVEDIQLSIAHKGMEAVAIARYQQPVGIDIEEIKPQSEGFCELVFSVTELELLPPENRDEWIIRAWVAKEAYGKYLGKGLQGNPKGYAIAAINGDELTINDINIKTIKHNNFIIGWTL